MHDPSAVSRNLLGAVLAGEIDSAAMDHQDLKSPGCFPSFGSGIPFAGSVSPGRSIHTTGCSVRYPHFVVVFLRMLEAFFFFSCTVRGSLFDLFFASLVRASFVVTGAGSTGLETAPSPTQA